MKHLQVPETKPNNKNTKNHQKILIMQRLDGQWLQSYYRVNDCKALYRDILITCSSLGRIISVMTNS